MTQSLPKVTLNILAAGGIVQDEAQKVLFIAQMVRNHTQTDNPKGTFDPGTGTLVTNVPDDDALNSALYGPRSILADMLREARKVNPITRFDAFVLPDASSGIAAKGDFTFTGTATENTQVILAIGSERNHTITFDVAEGEGVSEIDAGLPVAINADLTVPVVASSAGPGIIELFAANLGIEATRITLKVLKVPTGMAITVTPMTAGTSLNPALFTIFPSIESIRYQTLVWPETYDLVTGTPADSYGILILDLEGKFNEPNEILDGEAIIMSTQSFSSQRAQAQALDTQVLTMYSNEQTT